MVGSAGNAPVRRFRLCFATPDLQSGSRITSHGSWEREWESHPPEEVYEASLCALVEFPAAKWWSRRVTLPLGTACKAGASLFSHGPTRIGKSPWCCPRQAEFWRLGRTGWCATCGKLKGPGAASVCGRPQGPPGPCHFNKEQTPPGDLLDPSPRFHGGCFGVLGHTSSEALRL